MKKETYRLLEDFMLSCMEDAAHDKEHVYRVLYHALEIAKAQERVDTDVLIAACLLHDIGRKEQFADPSLCHAAVGSGKAYRFLREHGFSESFSEHVRQCILTHRYREHTPPQSIEAKILFDADKLDVTGAIGIARTLVYKGIVGEPLYSVLPDGTVRTGENDPAPSFFQEYKYKLEGLYTKFYTETAQQIARKRQQSAADFYSRLYGEVCDLYREGNAVLTQNLTEK